MRFTATSGAGGRRAGAICAAIVLAVGVGATAAVSGASGTPSAATAKKKPKKCKKARWRCAPELYLLAAGGTYATPVFTFEWNLQVLLRKRRAGPGQVDYSPGLLHPDPEDVPGAVTMAGTGTGLDDHCLTSPEDAMFTVPRQVISIPPAADPYLSEFGVTFKLMGREKNTYGVGVGDVQPETSHIVGEVIVRCPDGTTHNDEFSYTDPALAVRALVARGKLGSRRLIGQKFTTFETSRGTAHDWVGWALYRVCGKDSCVPLK